MNLSKEYLMSPKGLDLLAKLFHSSREGIMIFNDNGEVEMANPRAEEMFLYSEDELLGKKVEELIPMDKRSIHKQHRKGFMENPSPRSMGLGYDLKALKKDGTVFPIEISLNYLRHEEQLMVVAFVTDITKRKENEAVVENQRLKLLDYAEELEQKVQERTSELEHMNLGLQSQIQERKMAENALKKSLDDLKKAEQEILKSLEKEKELGELKSRFVSMASHEFRTPLTTILSSANLIGKYKEESQQENREKHIDRITKNVQNLTAILNDFLSVEKLESGKQTVSKEVFELHSFLSDLVDEISPNLKKGQTIQLNAVPISIFSDEQILKNILLNLISNASKYSNEESIIFLESTTKGAFVQISVKDTGIGIPDAEKKNLFNRFFRAKNATNIQGTGLGLNIVKKYLDSLGGSIDFESKEGEGSTFFVSIPLNKN